MNRAERRRLEKSRKKSGLDLGAEVVEAIKISKLLLANKNVKAAYEVLLKYIKAAVNNEKLFQQFLPLAFQLGHYKDAELASLSAIKLWPKNADYYNAAGMVYEYFQKPDKAIEFFEKAIELDEQHKHAYYNLGNVYKSEYQYSSAIRAYKDALLINPSDIDAMNNLASTYHELSLDEEALELLLKIEKLTTPDFSSTKRLGSIYLNLGELEKAEKKFREALKFKENSAFAYKCISEIKKYSDLNHEDIREMHKLISDKTISDEDEMLLSFALGQVYEKFGEYDKAFSYIERGNALKRVTINYSITETEDEYKKIKQLYGLCHIILMRV